MDGRGEYNCQLSELSFVSPLCGGENVQVLWARGSSHEQETYLELLWASEIRANLERGLGECAVLVYSAADGICPARRARPSVKCQAVCTWPVADAYDGCS